MRNTDGQFMNCRFESTNRTIQLRRGRAWPYPMLASGIIEAIIVVLTNNLGIWHKKCPDKVRAFL